MTNTILNLIGRNTKTVLLVDMFSICCKIFSNYHHKEEYKNNVVLVEGLKFLSKVKFLTKADFMFFVWDTVTSRKIRRQKNSEYKQRPGFSNIFPDWKYEYAWELQTVTDLLPNTVTVLCMDGEADDGIYTIAKILYKNGIPTIIWSNDYDLFIVCGEVPSAYVINEQIIDGKEFIYNEFKIRPENYLLYKSLKGDSYDNISGIPLFWWNELLYILKTEIFLTLEQFFEFFKNYKNNIKLRNAILNNEELIRNNYNLVRLYDINLLLKRGVGYEKNQLQEILSKEYNVNSIDISSLYDNLSNYNYIIRSTALRR